MSEIVWICMFIHFPGLMYSSWVSCNIRVSSHSLSATDVVCQSHFTNISLCTTLQFQSTFYIQWHIYFNVMVSPEPQKMRRHMSSCVTLCGFKSQFHLLCDLGQVTYMCFSFLVHKMEPTKKSCWRDPVI